MKSELRKAMKHALRAVSPASLERQLALVAATLTQLPAYAAARRVCMYMHMDHSEVRTLRIVEQCFADGKQVFLPQTLAAFDPQWPDQRRQLVMRRVHTMDDVAALVPTGPYKLREPTTGEDFLEHACASPHDLIVVPGVAFTAEGRRMGHGAGFYDDFIARYRRQGGRGTTVGIGLAEQLVVNMFTDEHDQVLDQVVIGDHVYA